MGSVDHPFNPLSLALGAEATFVARALDNDRTQLTQILTAAAHHRGTALIEIYQNCPIFNDGAFDDLKNPEQPRLIPLEHGKPAATTTHAVVRGDYGLDIIPTTDADPTRIVIHDTTITDPAYAYALTRLTTPDLTHVLTGIYRNINRPTYDDQVRAQVSAATSAKAADLGTLLTGSDTWTVGR